MTYGKIFYSLFFVLLLGLTAWLIDWRLVPLSPFTYWILFAGFVEPFTHSIFINSGIDVTPENMTWGRRLVVILPRLVVGFGLAIFCMPLLSLQFLYFFFGCLFIHLFIFGPVLNKLTGKDWDHLDDGYTDRFLYWISRGFFPARVFFLYLAAAGMIALFYR